MTDEAKRTLLEYMSGKLENNCGDNIPQFTDLNNKTNNLEDMFKERNINFSILGFAESPKTSNILLYGNNSIGKLDYGVIVVLDSEFNVLEIIDGFNSGTRFRQFICLDFDNEGNCYGIDNVENIDEPDKFRFILLNNFLIKLGNKYQVVLRNSYYFPEEYNSMYFDDPRNTNKIMKKDFANAYYSFFGRNDTTLSGRLITLKINVGTENEWKHYDFSETLEPQLFDYSITFLEDGIDFDVCVINETNFYRLKNVGDTINKYFQLSLGDISFGQSLIKINDNKIYLTTSKKLIDSNSYETKIMMISNNKLYEIFSETKESSYLSNICRLVTKNNDCFVIRYNFRNDPDIYYNVDFYTGILLENKYYEKYLGYFELNSYSAGNMFVKNEFNLFKICVLDVNNIKYSSLVYNNLNYNGKPCIQPNSLVANSGILYQDNMPIFARNLYNKSLNDNLTVSTIEVPNNYLNNILVNREVLKSKTNLSLVDKSEQIIKNEYENVYINFLNSINMRNENDPQRPVSNLTGAIRVTNSINLENDVDNTKVIKCKIVYDSGKEVIKNIEVDLANNTVTDSNPTLTNSLNKKLNYLKVEGKTVQNGTPTPDTPIEINNVKGYRNLFDMGTSLEDYFATGNNGLTISASDIKDYVTAKFTEKKVVIDSYDNTNYRWMSKEIVLKKNADYLISGLLNKSLIVKVVGIDNLNVSTVGKQVGYMNNVNSKSPQKFNSGNYNKYIISIYPNQAGASFEDLQIIEGNIERPYTPYGSNYLELKAYGKNLFEFDKTPIEETKDGITMTKNSDDSITFKGVSAGNPTFYFNSLNEFNEFKDYTFSIKTIHNFPAFVRLNDIKKNDPFFQINKGQKEITFNYTENYFTNNNYRLLVWFASSLCLIGTKVDFTIYPMLEKGDKATEYEQYQANSTLVNLQNNEICEGDTLIVQNGYVSIDKNKKILELTGEEPSWLENTATKGLFQITLENVSVDLTRVHAISTHFIGNKGTDIAKPTDYIDNSVSTYSGNRLFFRVNSYANNLNGFKQFLKDQKANGTPVIVQYKLATNENIGLGLQEQLTAYDNVTYVSCDDDLQPNLEINYLINENYSTLSTTIYVDELLKELQFISNDEKTVYQTINISNLEVGNYYTINQRMEVK